MGRYKYNFEKIKSKFIHINSYLNVKFILNFFKRRSINSKKSLIHKNNHICNIHTLGELKGYILLNY